MLSHPLLAQNLPVVPVKSAQAAGATGFDQLIVEKMTFSLIGPADQNTASEPEAEVTSKEDPSLVENTPADPATTSDMNASPDLAQSDVEIDSLTGLSAEIIDSDPQSSPNWNVTFRANDYVPPQEDTAATHRNIGDTSSLTKAEPDMEGLTAQLVETVDGDPKIATDWNGSDWMGTFRANEPLSPPHDTAATPRDIGQAPAPDLTKIVAAGADTTVRSATVVDAEPQTGPDGKVTFETPVSGQPLKRDAPIVLDRKLSTEAAPKDLSLPQVAAPEIANVIAPETAKQHSFASLIDQASAQPALGSAKPDLGDTKLALANAAPVLGDPASDIAPDATPVRGEPADLSVDIVEKSGDTDQKALASGLLQSQRPVGLPVSNDITPRQGATQETTTVAPRNAASGLVEVSVQPAPVIATDAPRSFDQTLSKTVADLPRINTSPSIKTSEVQPLGDTPSNSAVQPWRPTLTPTPAIAESQPDPAPQPSKSPIVRQVMDQLVQYPTQNGIATIRLKPHGMGVIEITIDRTKEGNLTVDMRVQNPLVLEAMRNERGAISHLFQPTGNGAAGTLSMDLFQSGTGRNGQDQHGQTPKDAQNSDADNTPEDPKNHQNTPIEAQNKQTRDSGVLNILT